MVVMEYLEAITTTIITITTIIDRVIIIMVVDYLEEITTTIIITITTTIARVIIIIVVDYLEVITTTIIITTTIVQVIIITVGVDYLITAPTPRLRMHPTIFLQIRMVMFFKKIIREVLTSETIRPIAGTNHNRLI